METRTAVVAVVLCAALMGCASPGPVGGPGTRAKNVAKVCNGINQCGIAVTVDRSCGFKYCLQVTDEFVLVVDKANAKITWELAAVDQEDFRFDRDKGIAFDADAGDFDCHVEADGRRFFCTDNQKNRVPTVYKYTVNVIKVKGVQWPVSPLDPWVINN